MPQDNDHYPTLAHGFVIRNRDFPITPVPMLIKVLSQQPVAWSSYLFQFLNFPQFGIHFQEIP